jgi:transcriptional regulator with XRE-family HTH domain
LLSFLSFKYCLQVTIGAISCCKQNLVKTLQNQTKMKKGNFTDDQSLVQVSVLRIFSLNGYDDPALMTQRSYEHISNEIEKKSGIVISGTTIRRLSKGAFNRLPQIATLNAIANYFDCPTWQEYLVSINRRHASGAEADQKDDDEAAIAGTGAVKKITRKKLILSSIALALLTVSFFGFYFYPKGNQPGNFENALFTAEKTTLNDLPNTVAFHYDVDNVNADSFFIQQSWDKNRRVRIYKNDHTLTDIYYEPGYHVAKLIANDSVIKTIDVNISTDRWVIYANENKAGYLTEYISAENLLKKGSLAITKEDLTQSQVDADAEKIFLYSYFPSKHDINSDNYTLKTRLRMNPVTNNRCPYIAIEVYGQRNFSVIKSTPQGCAHLASLWFSEQVLGGKENDLSGITYDVTQWTDIEWIVRDKKVSLKINNEHIFSTSYLQSMNQITGLSFISNGLCEVDHVSLVGSEGKIFYQDSFD